MRKNIKFDLDEEDATYIKFTKENMKALEEENKGIFGDKRQYLYAYLVNRLEDWEKNLLILYSKYKSYPKVAERLNVQKSTTSIVIKEITDKINNKLVYYINGNPTYFN